MIKIFKTSKTETRSENSTEDACSEIFDDGYGDASMRKLRPIWNNNDNNKITIYHIS